MNKQPRSGGDSEEVKGLMGLGCARRALPRKTSRLMRSGARSYIGSQEIHLNIGVGFPPRSLGWCMVSFVRVRLRRAACTLPGVVAQFRPPELFDYVNRVLAIGVDAVSALANRRSFGAAERVPILQGRVSRGMPPSRRTTPRLPASSRQAAVAPPQGSPGWAITSSCTWAKRQSPFDPGRLGWSGVLCAVCALTGD
jgi:hypothetical protein